MHVLIPLYPERKGSATEITFHTGWHLYFKQTFRFCKYERRTIDSGKGQDLFNQRMLFSIFSLWLVSPALVMEIRRNNSNTCTTAEEIQKMPIYEIQSDHTNEHLILHIYFSWFTPCTEDKGEPA